MCAPTTSQYAAVEALRNGDRDVKEMRESYNQRRRFLMHTFKEMNLECFEPFGAFYAFPSIKRFGMTSEEFAERLLKEEKVAVVPGTAIWSIAWRRVFTNLLCLFDGRFEKSTRTIKEVCKSFGWKGRVTLR